MNLKIVNPMNFANYTFRVRTFDSENYEVGSGVSNVWSFDCFNTVCRSCDNTGKCNDCYGSALTTFTIFDTTNRTCVSQCVPGFFFLNNITCSICDSNCSECANTSKRCIKCIDNYFLDTNYNICLPNCSIGYFNNEGNKLCTAC